jgi:hypothetical protein
LLIFLQRSFFSFLHLAKYFVSLFDLNFQVERRMIRLLKHTLKSKAATINASRAFISLYEAVGSAKKEDIVAALHHSLKLKKKQQSST